MKMIGVAVMCAAISKTASAYDITNAIDASLKNNVQIKDAEISLKGAQLKGFEAATQFLPKVAAQSSIFKLVENGDMPKKPKERQDNLSISQEIFSSGRGIYDLKAAKFLNESVAIQYQNNIDVVIINTVQAYENVTAARQMYNVALQNVQTLQKIVDQSEIKLRLGAITLTNLLEAKARFSSAVSSREKAFAEMKNAEENFKYVTGDTPPDTMSEIDITNLVLPKTVEIFLDEIDRESPAILSADNTLKSTTYRTKSAKTIMLPTLTASASLVREGNGIISQKEIGQTYQLSMSIPIFQGGAEYVKIKGAQLEEESAFNKRTDAILKAHKDGASAWNSYTHSKSSVAADIESVNYYQAFLAGAEQEFNIGTKTLTDFLQAQIQYENARVKLIQDSAQMIVSALNLKFLTGKIDSVNFSKLVMKDKKPQRKDDKLDNKEKFLQKNDSKITTIAEIKS